MNHKIILTDEAPKALLERLTPIRPIEYDLTTYAILRNLTGRFERLLLKGG